LAGVTWTIKKIGVENISAASEVENLLRILNSKLKGLNLQIMKVMRGLVA